MDKPASGEPSTNVTPAAPAASSSTVQPDFNSRASSAKTPADIRRLTQEMMASAPKPGSTQLKPVQAPAPEPVAEVAPAAEPEATTAPASEETPAADAGTEQTEETTTPPADQDHTQDTTEEDGGEGPVTPLTGKRAHIRVPDSEVDKLALAYTRRNRDWSLSQALEAAQKQLGIKPQSATATAPEAAEPASKLPKTVADTQSAIAQRRADYKKAMAEVRFEDAADIQTEIDDLHAHRSSLERRADQEEVQRAAKYDTDFTASEAKAVDLYPFAADPASSGNKRMMQIDAQLKANDDPLYYAPNKPLKLAQMVAAELNIAPRNKNAAPAKPAAVPVANGAPKKGVVPSGSSRTTPPAQNQPAVDPSISGIRSVADLRKEFKRLGIPH